MSSLTADLEAIRQFIGFGFAQLLNVMLMLVFGMGDDVLDQLEASFTYDDYDAILGVYGSSI